MNSDVSIYNIDIEPIKCPYGYIYKTTDLITGKSYVGQSTKIYSKDLLNKNNILSYYGSGTMITNVINKRKETLFKSIIDLAYSKKELDDLEIYYIKYFNTLKPGGYNIREGGNSTGRYYKGSLNPASSVNMSAEDRHTKAIKGVQTKRERGHKFISWNTSLDMTNSKLNQTINKTWATIRENGNDYIRIANGIKTKKENNIYKSAALKAAKSIRESGVLRGANGANSVHYTLYSPNNLKMLDVNGTLKETCDALNINHLLLRRYLGKVVPKTNQHTVKSINTIGWKLERIGRCRDERLSKIKI